MNFVVNIDWKFIIALGGATAIVICASEMDSAAAEQVLTYAANSCKELVMSGYWHR